MHRTFLLLILCLFTVPALSDNAPFPGYIWNSPLVFGPPVALGADAYSATWPAEADYDEAQLELDVITTPREAVRGMEKAGVPVADVVLSTYLGLSGSPEEINKTLFMGGTAARRVYTSSVPRDHRVHVFQKNLDNGALVTVAVRVYSQDAPSGEVLSAIANSFKSQE